MIISANRFQKQKPGAWLQLDPDERILLFFGFIRQYKGLDLLIRAMADERIKAAGIKLLVAGEFYEDEKPYLDLIAQLGLSDRIILRTQFIPDSEVRNYLCAGDCVVQPYRNATQSGVTPLAYHFEKPMIVTNVGGLPALVPHEKAGLVTEPDPAAIADAILRFYSIRRGVFYSASSHRKAKICLGASYPCHCFPGGNNLKHGSGWPQILNYFQPSMIYRSKAPLTDWPGGRWYRC
jgi:glycosyltransferase involved in cell wall biosynthesis